MSILGGTMSESLETRYQGSVAAKYDQERSGSRRWRSEDAIFEEFLVKVHPERVLDCPFGTGRWIHQYDQTGASVLGVDISSDMLNEARSKIRRLDAYTLVAGSIFDHDFSSINVDLIVCVRFLNWVPRHDAMRAASRLSQARSPFMIVGCSVIPDDAHSITSSLMKAHLTMKNLVNRQQKQYVHDEAVFIKEMEMLSWRLEDKKFIFRNMSRCNNFYLFARTER